MPYREIPETLRMKFYETMIKLEQMLIKDQRYEILGVTSFTDVTIDNQPGIEIKCKDPKKLDFLPSKINGFPIKIVQGVIEVHTFVDPIISS